MALGFPIIKKDKRNNTDIFQFDGILHLATQTSKMPTKS
jgi:hypothetical protein